MVSVYWIRVPEMSSIRYPYTRDVKYPVSVYLTWQVSVIRETSTDTLRFWASVRRYAYVYVFGIRRPLRGAVVTRI